MLRGFKRPGKIPRWRGQDAAERATLLPHRLAVIEALHALEASVARNLGASGFRNDLQTWRLWQRAKRGHVCVVGQSLCAPTCAFSWNKTRCTWLVHQPCAKRVWRVWPGSGPRSLARCGLPRTRAYAAMFPDLKALRLAQHCMA